MGLVHRRGVLAWAAFALGCGSTETEAPVPPETPAAPCAPGEWQHEDGRCLPAGLPPDMRCPPAEWWSEEAAACIPAGVPADGCGEGFAHDGDRGCSPILPASACPPSLMAVPGEMRCRAVAPCAGGTYGDIPVEPNTVYVDASYAGMDSDGSALKPWTAIQVAVDNAPMGAIVAVAAGSYAEDVLVSDKPVRLWGVCPTLVEIVGTGAAIAAVVVFGAGATEVRNLAIRGGSIGVGVTDSLDVLLDSLWIHDNATRGLIVEGAYGPAQVLLRGSLLEHNHDLGVHAAGASATLEASVVRTTLPLGNGFGGYAASARVHPANDLGGTLTLRRTLVEENSGASVLLYGSVATIEDSVVRTTQPGADGAFGQGVSLQPEPTTQAPSTLSMRGSVIERNRHSGLFVEGSQATIESSVVRDTEPSLDALRGRGVSVQSAATTGARANVLFQTSLIEQNYELGIYVDGSDLVLERSAVRANQPDAQGIGGRGVSAEAHAVTAAPSTLTVSESLVADNHDIGVFIAGSEATVEASVVRGTQPDAHGFGRAFGVQRHPTTFAPATLFLTSSLVEQNHDTGVLVVGSQVTIDTSVIRATDLGAQGLYGRGVSVQAEPAGEASTLVLQRSVVEESHEMGIVIFGSAATIESSVIRDVLPNGEGNFGDGVMVLSYAGRSSHADITRTRIDRAIRAGVAAFGASAALTDTWLTCQEVDLDSETYESNAATIEDRGGNQCGCPEATERCKALSASLAPPEPPAPVGR